MRLLLIDNYDSFTYNLLHLYERHGLRVQVVRNDAVTVADIAGMRPDCISISPGPGTPDESGICKDVVRHFGEFIPMLGVCLGMQIMNEVHGGTTAHAPLPLHGKQSDVYHENKGLMEGLPSPFKVARYHSLCVERLGEELEILARSEDGVVQALQHRRFPLAGVQFHPESFMTSSSSRLIDNFLALAAQWARRSIETQ